MAALLLVAPVKEVASFILRKGVLKAGRKYGPKLIEKGKNYINKNKLILSGNKVITPKKGSIKTVRPVNKKTTTKKTAPTGTNKPGAKSKVPAFIVAAGTIGGGAALMTSNKDKKSGSGMTFKEAFAKARKEKGKLATFTYKGKSYSTATADDVKKAGFKSLREYLNAKKK